MKSGLCLPSQSRLVFVSMWSEGGRGGKSVPATGIVFGEAWVMVLGGVADVVVAPGAAVFGFGGRGEGEEDEEDEEVGETHCG
jgi:hypothetical protein